MLNGLDIASSSGFSKYLGARAAVVANHSSISQSGRTIADLIHEHDDITLEAIFSPEHGFRGVADEDVADSIDPISGAPVYSLFGTRTKPSAEQLRGLTHLFFDIQDIGSRFYTYISTLGNVMDACAEFGVHLVVLDRPNPITGTKVEGPMPDISQLNFVGYHEIPIRHGLTLGEMALLFQKERFNSCELSVELCQGWTRAMWFDELGQYWVNPSPNMRSLMSAMLYPGIAIMEFTNVSVGRGTDQPFQRVGAPYIDGANLADVLRTDALPGLRFIPVRFTPSGSKYVNDQCGGIDILVIDRDAVKPVEAGWSIATRIQQLCPNEFQPEGLNKLLLNTKYFEAFTNQQNSGTLFSEWAGSCDEFRRRVQPTLLYP